MAQNIKNNPLEKTPFKPSRFRSPNAFILATIVSGFSYYFSRQQIKQFNSHQNQLIARVQNNQTAENFKKNFDYQNLQDWNCKKVNLDGVLKQGRFIIKRNRDKQEGYLVLAPFIVSSKNYESNLNNKFYARQINRKFILNLGWIPKSRKHLILNTVSQSVAPQEIYTDILQAKQKQLQDGLARDRTSAQETVPVSNVTAYIRTGQHEDRLNGRINWKYNFLIKWINLRQLTRVFRVFNEQQAQTIYLQRTYKSQDEPETFPISATKQTVIGDLKTQSKNYEKNVNNTLGWITAGSFGLALWSTFF